MKEVSSGKGFLAIHIDLGFRISVLIWSEIGNI
jgi:hypothetical protein